MKKFLLSLIYLLFLTCCNSLQVNVKSFENWKYNNKPLTYKIINSNNTLEENYYLQEIHRELNNKNFVEDNINPKFVIKANFIVKENIYESLKPTYIHTFIEPWAFEGNNNSSELSYNINNNYYNNIYTHSLKIEILDKNNKVFEGTSSLNYKSDNINETYKFLINSIFKSFPGDNAVKYTYIINKKTGAVKMKTKKYF